jgi:hypothetical protein
MIAILSVLALLAAWLRKRTPAGKPAQLAQERGVS